MTKILVELMEEGSLRAPAAEIVKIAPDASESEVDAVAKELGAAALRGFGKKLLLKFE